MYKAGDKVMTRYTRQSCVVVTATATLNGLQRLELRNGRDLQILDSDMVELITCEDMGLSLDKMRKLAKHYVGNTNRPVCIIHCKSWGYQLMEEPKARGRNIIETIYPKS
jgi:hypothetical protein